MRILGIETSCDETAAAVVEDGRRVRSSVVSSQVKLHAPYGGVVPELASRAHVELINPVVDEALMEAGILDVGELDAVAACYGPGLAGALLVGVSAAKALALSTGLPYIQVNHLEAHLYAGWLEEPDLEPPLAVLIVSGGHTLLVVMEGHGRYRMIDRLAAEGDRAAIAFPRPMLDEGYDFSFSGLKTAVVNHVRKHPGVATPDVAASFQEAVVDVLTAKLVAAADESGAPTLVLGGGVAANSRLRDRVAAAAEASGRRVFLPPLALCTDNGAMIAAAAWWRLQADGPTPLDAGIAPSLALPTII